MPECYAGSDLRITNRWGNECTPAQTTPANGTAKAVRRTYYYQFDRSDGQRFTGSVQILRERQ